MLSDEETRVLRPSFTLLVGFVVLSFFADSGASRLHVITGTVAEWQAGQSISIANEQTDPGGFRIALRDTVHDGDCSAMRPGVRATVWYRFVGERYPVAAKVRVLVNETMNCARRVVYSIQPAALEDVPLS